jgi:hypothetical protein
VAASGGFDAGGGFDVEPAMIAGAAAPLASALDAGTAFGMLAALHTSAAAWGAGEGPLAEELTRSGSELSAVLGELATALSAGAQTLKANAEAYARSDAPLPGAP